MSQQISYEDLRICLEKLCVLAKEEDINFRETLKNYFLERYKKPVRETSQDVIEVEFKFFSELLFDLRERLDMEKLKTKVTI